jgi:hypothetical protein
MQKMCKVLFCGKQKLAPLKEAWEGHLPDQICDYVLKTSSKSMGFAPGDYGLLGFRELWLHTNLVTPEFYGVLESMGYQRYGL